MCDWVTMLYSRILTEHCKPGIMEKNHYKKKTNLGSFLIFYWVTDQKSKNYLPLGHLIHRKTKKIVTINKP